MFGRGVRLFRLLGFEIRIDWSWLIIAGLLSWSLARHVFPAHYMGLPSGTYWWMGAVGVVGLFISIILHELGHSLVARRFGLPMRGITLFIFGGVAEMGGEPPHPKAEFFTAIAGPAVTVILAGVFFGLTVLSNGLSWPISATAVLEYLAWVNAALLAFNLVPAFPLDGGRILRSVLWAWRRNLRWASRIAANLGMLFGLLLIAGGVFVFIFGGFVNGLWYLLIGLFIRNASQTSYQQVLLREMLAGEPVSQFMTLNPVTVSPADSVKSVVESYLYRYPYRFYPVVDNGELRGCITIVRIKMLPKELWERRTAETIVEPCSSENVIEPEADATKALSTMSHNKTGRLMVVDHGHLVGVVALKDLLNFLSRKLEFETA